MTDCGFRVFICDSTEYRDRALNLSFGDRLVHSTGSIAFLGDQHLDIPASHQFVSAIFSLNGAPLRYNFCR